MSKARTRATSIFGRIGAVGVGVGAAIAAFATLAVGCGGDEDPARDVPEDAAVDRVAAQPGVTTEDAPEDAGSDAALADVELPDGGCNVRIATAAVAASAHVPEGTPITYDTNPPAGGPHYPVWAHFQEYANAVADGYLVHSMEHGGVLLLYKCDPSQCPGILAGLRAARDAVATDPSCDVTTRVRVIIAPRPDNDVPVAAAAWGTTYRADCVDVASLTQFVTAHYAKAPENTCAAGRTTF